MPPAAGGRSRPMPAAALAFGSRRPGGLRDLLMRAPLPPVARPDSHLPRPTVAEAIRFPPWIKARKTFSRRTGASDSLLLNQPRQTFAFHLDPRPKPDSSAPSGRSKRESGHNPQGGNHEAQQPEDCPGSDRLPRTHAPSNPSNAGRDSRRREQGNAGCIGSCAWPSDLVEGSFQPCNHAPQRLLHHGYFLWH